MKLQKSPLGLLSAFALKHLGQNPTDFGDSVLPSADVYDQYVANDFLKATPAGAATVNAGATIGGTTIAVPTGKVWRVLAGGFSHSVNAADVAISFFGLAFIVPPGGAASAPAILAGQSIGAPTARGFGRDLARPLILPAGWQLSVQAYASAAPANNTTLNWLFLVHEFDV